MKKSISLRSLFALSFSIIIIILIVVITSAISIKTTEGYKNQIGSTLSEVSYQMADKLDHYMWSRYGEVSLLSKIDTFSNLENITEIRNLIEELQKNAPEYAWIGVLDTEGNVVTATGGILEGKNISARPVYQQALEEPFIGDVHEAVLLSSLLPNPTGEEMKFVDISMPIKDENGNLQCILATHLSWKWAKEIEDSIMKPLKYRHDLDLFIISNDNTVLLGPDGMLGEKLELESINNSKSNESNWMVETWQDGKEYLTGYSSENGYKNYKGLGWTILVRQPLNIAYEPVEELRDFIIIIGVVLAIIFAFIGWIIAGVIAKPLKKIVLSADKLRLGQQVEIPEYHGIKDIELLSVSLRSLIGSLINTENALGEMEGIAHRDQLTGLSNREALIRYLEKIKVKLIAKESIFIFYYLDLDGFKLINDIYGHDSGDLMLKEVSKRLNLNAGEDVFVARLGGDEFIVIRDLDTEKFIEDSIDFANRLIEEINKPYIIQGKTMAVGCSIGGAFYHNHSQNPMDVMKLADEYLYKSKSAGKNRYTYAELKG